MSLNKYTIIPYDKYLRFLDNKKKENVIDKSDNTGKEYIKTDNKEDTECDKLINDKGSEDIFKSEQNIAKVGEEKKDKEEKVDILLDKINDNIDIDLNTDNNSISDTPQSVNPYIYLKNNWVSI